MSQSPPNFDEMLEQDELAEQRLLYGEIALLVIVLATACLYRLLIV